MLALTYVYLCFSIFLKETYPHSDCATLVLWANDIVSGNLFLRDWFVSTTIFLTTDLLFHMIGVKIFGVHANAFYAAVTLIFLTFSLSSLLLYKWHGIKSNAMNIFIWLAIGALPIGMAPVYLLFHTALWIYVFVACFFIEKMYKQQDVPGKNKGYLAIILICLTLGTIGDFIFIVGCILPILIVCFYLLLTENKQSGFCIKLAVTSFIALILGLFLIRAYYSIGGIEKMWSLNSTSFKSSEDIPNGIIIYLQGLLELFDAYFPGKPLLHPNNILYCLRILIIIFGFYIVITNIVLFFKGKNNDIISVILSLGFVFLSAVYILIFGVATHATRYYAYTPILFSVLIGRFLFNKKFLQVSTSASYLPDRIQCFFFALCVLLIFGIIVPGQFHKKTEKDYPEIKLGELLIKNDLKNGYASYWDASATTVAAGNKSTVRAITVENQNLLPFNWLSKKSWYNYYANFIVINESGLWGVTEENIKYCLGPPAQILTLNNFIVYVYDYDISKTLYGSRLSNGSSEDFENTRFPYISYELGDTVDLRKSNKYQFVGWSYPEEWGTWTDNDKVELAFYINNNIDLVLHLNITAVFNENPVDVFVNNILIDNFNFFLGENTIQIPKEIYPEQIVKIRFEFNDLQSPLNLGLSGDVRKLGICVSSIFLTGN